MMRWTLVALAAIAGTPAAAQTLLEEMAETGRFERFLAGVEAAGLAEELTGPGPVTVLAPTDEAYERFVGPELAAAFADDPALARLVLETHIAEGAAHAADDLPRTIDVLNGETVTVEWTGSELLAVVDGGTETAETVAIEGGDVRSGNGIAHPITGVLLPRNATLDALVDPDRAGAAAPATAEAPEADAPPIPDDGSYLDDLVEGADQDTIALAPTEGPTQGDDAAQTDEVAEAPEAPTTTGGGNVTVLTTDGDAATEEGVIVLTPTEGASRPAEAPPAEEEAEAARIAEEAAETAAAVAPEPAGEGGTVIVEEMNVTVESAPRVEPRTVAPSVMMGSPEAPDPAAQPAPAPEQGEASAPPAEPMAVEQEEAFIMTSLIGWPVYGQDGEEVGEVEHVIILEGSGAMDGVLVEVGGFLGTDLGGHLIRVDLDELRIDSADEAIVATISGGDLMQREEYQGPELDP